MQLIQFYYRHRLHRLASHPDLHFFELAIWLHTLARSLISVFVPILLLTIGYPLGTVIVYYLIYNVIDVPLNFVAAGLIRRTGARNVLILGTLATIAFFALLGGLPPGDWVLLVTLAILAAVYDTCFWVAHIYLFNEANRDGMDTGETVGALEAIRHLAAVAGPAVGALVLLVGGKVPLVATSIAIFVLSIVPLFKLKHIRNIPREKMVSFREFFKDGRERRNYLSLMLFGIHSETEGVLWPIFIFALFGTFKAVAAVPIIVALTTVVFSYTVGKFTKKYQARMIAVGSILIMCMWILRLTVHDTLIYYATVFLVGLFSLLVSIPVDGAVTARGVEMGSLAASMYRNAASMSGRVLLFAVLALVVGVFHVSFILAVVSLFALFVVNVFFTRSLKRKMLPPAALIDPAV